MRGRVGASPEAGSIAAARPKQWAAADEEGVPRLLLPENKAFPLCCPYPAPSAKALYRSRNYRRLLAVPRKLEARGEGTQCSTAALASRKLRGSSLSHRFRCLLAWLRCRAGADETAAACAKTQHDRVVWSSPAAFTSATMIRHSYKLRAFALTLNAFSRHEVISEAVSSSHGGGGRSPRITEQPVDVVVRKHEPVTLRCGADGDPPPRIAWYHDGRPVRNSATRMVLPEGQLFFLQVQHSRREQDTGLYWCTATNAVGTVRSRNASVELAAGSGDKRRQSRRLALVPLLGTDKRAGVKAALNSDALFVSYALVAIAFYDAAGDDLPDRLCPPACRLCRPLIAARPLLERDRPLP
ncbi:hypothetical protein HPB51_004273 [Rhipicephalus microplus]|uniref:Ig-like domain-containing protein n=1 Tax=Rhipicephalus microplus TaxID=6941 RepID=A0A9J6DKM7_RHIMP|nr:hypothetical protein HPB51_004273 [Rhipicephalus microplus]